MNLPRAARHQIDADTGLVAIADFLAADHAVFTAEELALRSGRSISDVLDHLHAAPDYAIDAAGKQWTTIDAYLSGEFWPKLDAVNEQLAHEDLAPEYRAEKAA